LAASLLSLTAASAPAPVAPGLEIDIAGLRSDKGVIRLCLTADPVGFPDCKHGKGIERTLPATNPRIRLEGLTPGAWAIAAIHDENGNSKLDTFAGIPREGFGFSRNPAIGFGPPRFQAASFEVGAGGQVQQIKMRYLL
jgi:uncharacterized protein (DUF2141 family)